MLPTLTVSGLQTKLDHFRGWWYNQHRVHAALGACTPNEAAERVEQPAPVPIRTRDHLPISIAVARRFCRGDPRLPILDIAVRHAA